MKQPLSGSRATLGWAAPAAGRTWKAPTSSLLLLGHQDTAHSVQHPPRCHRQVEMEKAILTRSKREERYFWINRMSQRNLVF